MSVRVPEAPFGAFNILLVSQSYFFVNFRLFWSLRPAPPARVQVETQDGEEIVQGYAETLEQQSTMVAGGPGAARGASIQVGGAAVSATFTVLAVQF